MIAFRKHPSSLYLCFCWFILILKLLYIDNVSDTIYKESLRAKCAMNLYDLAVAAHDLFLFLPLFSSGLFLHTLK